MQKSAFLDLSKKNRKLSEVVGEMLFIKLWKLRFKISGFVLKIIDLFAFQ